MTDSVLTVHAEPLSRDTSTSSQVSTSAEKPRGTSGADLILPIIIFAVVKANPPQLASQLMYLRRYRSAICLTGEASYALVNLTAVVEFLEHVDLAELGLGGDSDKVIRWVPELRRCPRRPLTKTMIASPTSRLSAWTTSTRATPTPPVSRPPRADSADASSKSASLLGVPLAQPTKSSRG
jgi:hypothetical protein